MSLFVVKTIFWKLASSEKLCDFILSLGRGHNVFFYPRIALMFRKFLTHYIDPRQGRTQKFIGGNARMDFCKFKW